MTTENNQHLEIPELKPEANKQFVIIQAQWNPEITNPLTRGAEEVLHKAGVKDIVSVKVPGTV